ncbi:L,D-transpeptidase family protein [Roseimicrobium sp. ORNL1]|uniref:L,D-transpeptidase family protein n=1 Tax=Roseimicrobium sp. ORNL1 TaxID=2711231 RepID=UPI0013E0FB94|nr:L,D-transpeptidase family protein [Roseimicrobium sp. ORNL1]QIF00822.1 L,D-transpeptidase family protein [Roseimicrobium sp. ORNL1]
MVKKAFAACVITLVAVLTWANWPGTPLPTGVNADRVVVVKSSRELILFRESKVLKRYRVSLGRVPIGPKEREGDGKTPEGVYRITEHKRDSTCHLALRISYPGAKDIQRAKAAGVSPGSDIMVHGIRNGWGFLGRSHRFTDWTAGCVAVTNPEIREILSAVPVGTVIEIRE